MTQYNKRLLILGLMFHPTMNNYGWDMGGAEKRFIQLCKFLTTNNDVIHMIEPAPSLARKTMASYKFFEVGLDSKISCIFGRNTTFINWFIKALKKSISLCKKYKYDMILAHDVRIFDLFIGLITSRLFKIPLVTIAHHLHWIDMSNPTEHRYNFFKVVRMERKWGAGLFDALIRSMAAFLESRLLRYVDYYISVSDSTARCLSLNGVQSEKIIVTGNGIDKDFIRLVECQRTERYDAIYVGRLYGGKGIFDLIKAWQLVVNRDRGAKLAVIGGTDASEEKPHELVHELKLDDNIVFKGYVSDEQLIQYLKSSKLFVLPSKMEGWGISVAEAIACGLPVVLYSIHSLNENFSEYEGSFFVPVGDIDALAKTILEVMRLPEERLKQIRNHASEFSLKLDLAHVFHKEYELLHRAAQRQDLQPRTLVVER